MALSRLAVVVHDSNDASLAHARGCRLTAWNPSAGRQSGLSEAEARVMNILDQISHELLKDALERIYRLATGGNLSPSGTRRPTKDGRTLAVGLGPSALIDATGRISAIAATLRRIQEERAP